jgi:toxin ParE1/3/4
MRKVVWAEDALRDFNAVIFYIAKDNHLAASVVADRIEVTAGELALLPTGYPGRVKGIYEKLVLKTPYIIAYALSDQAVTIVRIIHGRRNWQEDAWPE